MGTVVLSRDAELLAVDKLLDAGRRGRAALVLEGHPGIGKTTVWRQGVERAVAQGYRVLACRTAPTEARLAFTALSDLFGELDTESLPDPQRRALNVALLREEDSSATVNPRAIGMAVVSLLTALAATSEVLVAIDDLQWLDAPSASTLEFALRRLEALPIALLATARTGERGAVPRLPGIDRYDTVRLGPLSLAVLYRIIEAELGRALSRPLLVRIEQASGGNPFYALEIARAVGTTTNLAPGQPLPIPDTLRELPSERLRKLPRRTLDALLKVSALAHPTIHLVDVAALAPAEESGVVRVLEDGRIEFSHPLFANAVYAAASSDQKLQLHRELAGAATDIEERARHLVSAQPGNDANGHVANVLHDAAEHAARRGAVEVAAELEELAARRTPPSDVTSREQRELRAARHYLKAGDPGRSKMLCEQVLRTSPPSSVRAHALHVLSDVSVNDDLVRAASLLHEALGCVGDDIHHAAELEIALGLMMGATHQLLEAQERFVRAVTLAEQAQDDALLAEAIALLELSRLMSGQGLDEAALQRALALEDVDRDVPFQIRASFNVATAYTFIGRIDLARDLFLRLKERSVARGDDGDLAFILFYLAETAFLRGQLDVAEREAEEAERVAVVNRSDIFRAHALMMRSLIRAVRGHRDSARSDGGDAIALSERIGWPVGVEQARWGLGLLALSEGDPRAAAAIFDSMIVAIERRGVYEWPSAMALPDAIEALTAIDAIEPATRLTSALADFGRKVDRPWSLATAGRCRAMLLAAAGDLEGAATAAEQALAEHARLPMPFEHARTLLVHGQLQRRRGQRRAARDVLGRALAIFEEVGAPLWAEMCRAEIARIGVRRAPTELTENETRVAELAAQGLTNVEIAARLFMSRRTVEANLARAYTKLGISSRAELGAVMSARVHAKSAHKGSDPS